MSPHDRLTGVLSTLLKERPIGGVCVVRGLIGVDLERMGDLKLRVAWMSLAINANPSLMARTLPFCKVQASESRRLPTIVEGEMTGEFC